jgi:hypothetical protein
MCPRRCSNYLHAFFNLAALYHNFKTHPRRARTLPCRLKAPEIIRRCSAAVSHVVVVLLLLRYSAAANSYRRCERERALEMRKGSPTCSRDHDPSKRNNPRSAVLAPRSALQRSCQNVSSCRRRPDPNVVRIRQRNHTEEGSALSCRLLEATSPDSDAKLKHGKDLCQMFRSMCWVSTEEIWLRRPWSTSILDLIIQ